MHRDRQSIDFKLFLPNKIDQKMRSKFICKFILIEEINELLNQPNNFKMSQIN